MIDTTYGFDRMALTHTTNPHTFTRKVTASLGPITATMWVDEILFITREKAMVAAFIATDCNKHIRHLLRTTGWQNGVDIYTAWPVYA
jgi:hypothetical protein